MKSLDEYFIPDEKLLNIADKNYLKISGCYRILFHFTGCPKKIERHIGNVNGLKTDRLFLVL